VHTVVENAEDAKRIGLESREHGQTTIWTDGSQTDDGNVGCAVVWRIEEGGMEMWREGWNLEGYHLHYEPKK
jgi:hypothetical protein